MKYFLAFFLPIFLCSKAPPSFPALTNEKEIVQNMHGYVSCSFSPFPGAGLGARYQHGHIGIDLSGQCNTILLASSAQLNTSYLHFFNPSYKSQYYAGLGGTFHTFFFVSDKAHSDYYVAPALTLGKDFMNKNLGKRFFQLQINYPNIPVGGKNPKEILHKIPAAAISYGIYF